MGYMPNNVNVTDFDINDLLWNLEEYHRKSDNTGTVSLCDEIICAFHKPDSVMRIYYSNSEVKFNLWVNGDDLKYPRYVIKIYNSIEASQSKGSILMITIHSWDYKTMMSVMCFKGPVYQMRKNLTFNENKALGEWICGFDKGKRGSDED